MSDGAHLYYSPGACSFVAHCALEEIGAPYELTLISTKTGETRGDAWKAFNPKGRIPALSYVTGTAGGKDGILTELPAILFYLAQTHPEAGIWPKDPALQARCIEWMNWLSGWVHACSFGLVWRADRFTDEEAARPGINAKGQIQVRDSARHIESLLADGRDWAVPGGFTVVDPYLLLFWLWGRRLDIDLATLYPHWTALARKVAARPAVARVMQQEEIAPVG